MDKFRVGQKVRVEMKNSKRYGEIFKIIEPSQLTTDVITGVVARRYRLDVQDSSGFMVAYQEENLKPVCDGDEKSSWSECAWKPNEVKV